MQATIWHNPDCGTSRNTLALIRHAGVEPEVIDYLREPPSRERIRDLVATAGLTLRAALREKGTPYSEWNLGDPAVGDDALLDAIGRAPILLERPFVQTAKGVRLCRPSEIVLDLLPPIAMPFTKEDGEVVLPR